MSKMKNQATKTPSLRQIADELDQKSTFEQQMSANVNAIDTTGSGDSPEYLECYIATLKMLLDS